MRVIIVGCTHAGTMAAQQILAADPKAEVVIYERDDNISFLSCGIALYLDGTVKRLEDMFYSSHEDLEQQGVTVKTQHNVIEIDAKQRRIRVVDMKSDQIFDDHFDKLIMATGSSAVVPPLVGIDQSKVLMCKTYAHAQEIKDSAENAKTIALVGGGYVGVELAESYARTGHEVDLFQSSDQILNHYIDKATSDRLIKMLTEHGIRVHLNHRVKSFERNDNQGLSINTGDEKFDADLAIVTTGFMPVTELLEYQVEMDRHGAIIVDNHCQSSDPNVYAAGDCAISNFNPTGKPAYAPLATNAVRQGMIAGNNVVSDNSMPYIGTQATSAMSLFGYTIASSGLTIDYALKNGQNADFVTFNGTWRPDYMPTTDNLEITLVYNRDTREILGAQLISKHEVSQSANAISIAIQNRNTIDDLSFVDMLFQPYFDYPFNYLNLVGQMAVQKEREAGNHHPRYTALGNQQ